MNVEIIHFRSRVPPAKHERADNILPSLDRVKYATSRKPSSLRASYGDQTSARQFAISTGPVADM